MELIVYEVSRVHFKDQGYVYQVIKCDLIDENQVEFQILLNGMTQTIIKNENGWMGKNSLLLNQDLIRTIGASIANQYRLD